MEKALVQGDDVPQEYVDLVAPHVESFDYFLGDGMQSMVVLLPPMEIEHPVTKQTYNFWFDRPHVELPVKEDCPNEVDKRLMPRDCREMGTTYKGAFQIDLCYSSQEQHTVHRLTRRCGAIPIMVKSSHCHLRDMSRQALVAAKEESTEMGGYFICNGIERLIRLLVQTRRHYVMALRRGAYHKRGANYTDAATLVRCVRPDQSSATVRCHYLTDGTVNFAFTMRRAEYFIPAGILLKCFLEVSDRELYDKIMAGAAAGSGHAAFLAERAELLLHQASAAGLTTRAQCLEYLGKHFRVVLDVPARMSDHQVGLKLLEDYVFIHLQHPRDKLNLLLQMVHKLYALVNSACCEDNPDALTHHELLLPGHLLLKFLREKLQDGLSVLKELLRKELERNPEAVNLEDEQYVRKLMEKVGLDVGKKFEYLLNTGNLVSKSGLDLSQASGFTVVAEKLNFFRYLSHFRSVHRGAYFTEMRTTTVRKLLPESWGFMCPVHTPDGSPCGLLNHLAAAARVVTADPADPEDTARSIAQVCANLGMLPESSVGTPPPAPAYLPLMLDGCLLGYVATAVAPGLVARLREIKAGNLALMEDGGMVGPGLMPPEGPEIQVPFDMEVVHISWEQGGPFPGISLFTQASRLMRPVRQLRSAALELLGSLEQANMSIRCPDGGHGGSTSLAFTHEELSAGAMLSVVASLTPYSDYNQSPRNMYQCQMGKQTMGTPLQALPHRTDTKLYRIQTPQTPIARTDKYINYHMDEFPNGTNAVVAVLAYTGYDMEDAMILNKSSMERGLAHGSLYKVECIELQAERKRQEVLAAEKGRGQPASIPPRPQGAFGQQFPQNVPSLPSSEAVSSKGLAAMGSHKCAEQLDVEGLPHVGAVIWPGEAYYSTQDLGDQRYSAHKLKGEEVAQVEQVALIGTSSKDRLPQRANIMMRYNRNPVIGDKFSSRHGQKGVLSILWPDTDMPWCAGTGIRPDLIINPHAFPSRMTIGMLVESMASKAGAMAGEFVDATPFQRCDGKPGNPVEYFGQMLEGQGFARLGQETMISGITGEEMPCDIYVGLVYYQRLRHMVSDKFQVRSMGKINNLTKQPIKGRKMGGGIRFGEMERDSLLAHGAAYLLHDRLHSCSDYHVMDVCTSCGSILAPLTKPHAGITAMHNLRPQMDGQAGAAAGKVVCPMCSNSSRHIDRVAMPYVFKYLATELAAMNIKVSVEVK